MMKIDKIIDYECIEMLDEHLLLMYMKFVGLFL